MGEYVEVQLEGGGVVTTWVSPPQAPSWSDPDLNPQYWWINVGAFKDRNPHDYAAIAASNHDVCKAFIALTTDRQYIDLKGAILTLFDALIALSLPSTSPYIPMSGPLTVEKKAAWVALPTTEYERHVKGLVQPV